MIYRRKFDTRDCILIRLIEKVKKRHFCIIIEVKCLSEGVRGKYKSLFCTFNVLNSE